MLAAAARRLSVEPEERRLGIGPVIGEGLWVHPEPRGMQLLHRRADRGDPGRDHGERLIEVALPSVEATLTGGASVQAGDRLPCRSQRSRPPRKARQSARSLYPCARSRPLGCSQVSRKCIWDACCWIILPIWEYMLEVLSINTIHSFLISMCEVYRGGLPFLIIPIGTRVLILGVGCGVPSIVLKLFSRRGLGAGLKPEQKISPQIPH